MLDAVMTSTASPAALAQRIHAVRPGWMVFTDGCPGGEGPDQVEARIDRIIARIRAVAGKGNVAVFSRGHLSERLRRGGSDFEQPMAAFSFSIRQQGMS